MGFVMTPIAWEEDLEEGKWGILKVWIKKGIFADKKDSNKHLKLVLFSQVILRLIFFFFFESWLLKEALEKTKNRLNFLNFDSLATTHSNKMVSTYQFSRSNPNLNFQSTEPSFEFQFKISKKPIII
jgi:hypothetical protein